MAKISKGTSAVRALEEAGATFNLHVYDYSGEAGAIGVEAAMLLDIDQQCVFKTLIAEIDGSELVMAIIPVGFIARP